MSAQSWFNGGGIKDQLEKRGLDAVIAVSPENVFYTTRVFIVTQQLIRNRLAFVVWPIDKEPTLIICDIEEELAKDKTWMKDIRTYTEWASPMELLEKVLKERGLRKGKIGIEKKYLASSWYEELVQRVPEVTFSEADSLFEKVRSVKTKKELEWMEECAKILDRAILVAAEFARPGDSEKDISENIIAYARKLGGDKEIDTIASNTTSGLNILSVHEPPSARRLETGDIVHLHARATFRQYWIHLVRRAVVRRADSHQNSMYSKYVKIYHQAIEDFRSGRRAGDLFDKTKKELIKEDLFDPKWLKTGHSTGIRVIEPPALRSGEKWILEPGMVFAIEPVIREPGKAIYWLEDEVTVTNGDPVRISDVFPIDNLYVIR